MCRAESEHLSNDDSAVYPRLSLLCFVINDKRFETLHFGFSEEICFVRPPWYLKTWRRHRSSVRNQTVTHLFLQFFMQIRTGTDGQREPVNKNEVGVWKRESESEREGGLLKRKKFWALACYTVSNDFQSRTVCKGDGKGKGGGRAGVARRACWSQQIRALTSSVWFALPRPECSLQMSCGKIVFCMCF